MEKADHRPGQDIVSPELRANQNESQADLEQGKIPQNEKLATSEASEEDKAAFLVKFEKGDPDDPHSFSSYYKAWLLAQMSSLAFMGSLGSSIITPAEPVIAAYLNIGVETTVLTLSLFVLGFAFGPMLWAPISEAYGRKISMLPAVFIMGIFSIGSAVSKNTAALLITRFFAGLFGSAPISNVSAALGDIYDAKTRGVPMALLAMCVVGGPCLAPVIGAALTVNNNLGWRWTEYIQAILTFFVVAVTTVFLPETYGPVLLQRKAERVRKETGDNRYWHPQESQKMNINNIVTKHLSRPARMFLTEPIVTCIAIYASFIYGLLFFTIEAFPVVFLDQRRWQLVPSTLPFLGLFVGVLFALLINFANQPIYIKAVEKNKGRPVPEARLPPMIIGGFLFSTGLFWFGWTAAPKYSWGLPTVAAGFIGAGFNITFQQCLNFLVDVYGPYAASALSANTFLRSLLACALPMAARPLFFNLGVGPGCSLLGGISCLALPVPFIFMKYSLKLRKMSKFAPVPKD